jgi:regulator of PEP synthase PpsR (kinase-PPPase family)
MQHRWTTFTHIGKETKYFSKLFKHTNLKITYITNNSIEQNLKLKAETTSFASDVYNLTCSEKKYAPLNVFERFYIHIYIFI